MEVKALCARGTIGLERPNLLLIYNNKKIWGRYFFKRIKDLDFVFF